MSIEHINESDMGGCWPNPPTFASLTGVVNPPPFLPVKPGIFDQKSTLETDPNGLDQHVPGAKLDHGKIKADLVLGDFARALKAVCDVGTYGANKYTESGWVEVPNGIKRYSDAELRHWLSYKCGELRDKDTNLLHLAHKAWNSLAVLELTLREMENVNQAK